MLRAELESAPRYLGDPRKSAATLGLLSCRTGWEGRTWTINPQGVLDVHASQEMEGLPVTSSPPVSSGANRQIPSSHLPGPE